MGDYLNLSPSPQYGLRVIILTCLWHTFLFPTAAIDTSVKWSSVYQTSPPCNDLPTCAKPCIADVGISLGCWSWGCVCSENTPGANFINGTKYLRQCVQDGCPDSGGGVVDDTLEAFQSTCGMSGVMINASGPDSSPTPPALSPGEKPVLIDKPLDTYNELSPCVRWVLNNCESPTDNQDNCNQPRPGDHSAIWTGLGRHLQCATAECVCGGSKIFYAMQKLYERADLYCSIGFPYEGSDRNTEFTHTLQMLVDYCSGEGYILTEWIVEMVGWKKDNAMSQETIVAIGTGAGSGLLSIISIGLTWATLRRKVKKV